MNLCLFRIRNLSKFWTIFLDIQDEGEDVKELFSTIGQITSFKMIREGVALIIFLESEDVLRAIEVFHNCQLDGLPMNVTIVKKKCQKVQN